MKLTELAVFTDDVDDVAGFYRRLLGDEPARHGDGCAQFTDGDTTVLVHELYEPEDNPLPPETHVAFRVDDLDATCDELQSRGLTLEVPPRDFDWGRSAYLRDPAGNLVELSEDTDDQSHVGYRDVQGLPDTTICRQLTELYERAFHDYDAQCPDFHSYLEGRDHILTNLAVADGTVVGFKIGYRDSPYDFYSWLGGVDPDFRRRGIADELMVRQHRWAATRDYKTVVTETKNQFKAMIIVNLRHGFDVIGSYTDHKGEPKLILKKWL